jgi:hypothetical protein
MLLKPLTSVNFSNPVSNLSVNFGKTAIPKLEIIKTPKVSDFKWVILHLFRRQAIGL